jgi:hypothetical protein
VHHFGAAHEVGLERTGRHLRGQVGAEHAVEHPAGDERAGGDGEQAPHGVGGDRRARGHQPTERRRSHDKRDLLHDQQGVGGDPHGAAIGHIAQQLLRVRHPELDDDRHEAADDQQADPVQGERPAGDQVHTWRSRAARIVT